MPASSTAADGAKIASKRADKPLCRLRIAAGAGAVLALFGPAKGANIAPATASAGLHRNTGGDGREFMRDTLRLAGLAVLAMALLPSKAGVAQVLMQRDVSLKMALTIAEAAVAECDKAGNSVSVAVVDRAGRLRVFLQGDK